MTALYKVTDAEGRSTVSGVGFQYPLPKGKRPGAWTEPVTPGGEAMDTTPELRLRRALAALEDAL